MYQCDVCLESLRLAFSLYQYLFIIRRIHVKVKPSMRRWPRVVISWVGSAYVSVLLMSAFRRSVLVLMVILRRSGEFPPNRIPYDPCFFESVHGGRMSFKRDVDYFA